MNEPRCDHCKHWKSGTDENEEWEARGVGFKECGAVRERWRITDEATTNLEYEDGDTSQYQTRRKDALRAARAYVQDGSEYRAELFTAPDFFCALYSPQEPKP